MDQQQPSSTSVLRAIILMGLIVGTLDILSAIVDYYIATGKGPATIFKYIASAILDKQAFSGGTGIIVLGLLLHYLIAFLFTILFVALYRNIKFMSGNKLIVGVLYGILIGVIMNFIVVPLSLTPKMPYQGLKVIKAFLILICMIGLPLAFLAPRFLPEKK
jgi:hypothetical protein